MEINRGDFAHPFFSQKLFDAGELCAVAVVEAHDDFAAGPAFGVEDRLALHLIGGHGFFGQHVAACLQSLDDKMVVGGIDGGDDEQIGFDAGHHLVEIGEDRTVGSDEFAGVFHPSGVDVAESHEFDEIPVFLEDVFAPEAVAAAAGAHKGDFSFGCCRYGFSGCRSKGADQHGTGDRCT